MHVVDLRGVISVAGGSLLDGLCRDNASLGGRMEERLNKLNEMRNAFQRSHKTQHTMPDLRLQDLKVDGWAMMGGKLVKAANSRALVPWLVDLVERYYNGHGAYASSVRKVFKNLHRVEELFYSCGTFMGTAEVEELEACIRTIGRHWMVLREQSRRRRRNAWQVRPKLHYFMHLGSQARLINPRAVQVYQQESLVGRIAKIWRMCAQGVYAPNVQEYTLGRYWTALELTMTM